MTDSAGMYLLIEHDNATGVEQRLDNMGSPPQSDTYTRVQAEAAVRKRRATLSNRYSYDIRPVTPRVLDITGGDLAGIRRRAWDTGHRPDDPHEPPRVCARADGQPGAEIWAYAPAGATTPPGWLASLCAYFEAAGFTARIRVDQVLWAGRARRLLEQALYEMDGRDVLPVVCAAEAALRIQFGELPTAELDGYAFPGEPEPEPAAECTCPPHLLARGDGSFRGGCPVHG